MSKNKKAEQKETVTQETIEQAAAKKVEKVDIQIGAKVQDMLNTYKANSKVQNAGDMGLFMDIWHYIKHEKSRENRLLELDQAVTNLSNDEEVLSSQVRGFKNMIKLAVTYSAFFKTELMQPIGTRKYAAYNITLGNYEVLKTTMSLFKRGLVMLEAGQIDNDMFGTWLEGVTNSYTGSGQSEYNYNIKVEMANGLFRGTLSKAVQSDPVGDILAKIDKQSDTAKQTILEALTTNIDKFVSVETIVKAVDKLSLDELTPIYQALEAHKNAMMEAGATQAA